MIRYSAILVAAASLATSAAKAGPTITAHKLDSRVEFPSVAQPRSFEATSESGPAVATVSEFNYARTWELAFKDSDGVSRSIKFGVPKVTACPERAAGTFPGYRPFLVHLADNISTAWGANYKALHTPTVFFFEDEKYYKTVSFSGTGELSSPDLINGTVNFTTCPVDGGNCSIREEAATMRTVGAAPEVDFHMVVMKAGGNPITQDGAVFTTEPYVSRNPIYGYYFGEHGIFAACEVFENSPNRVSVGSWIGDDPSVLLQYRNQELNKKIDVEFMLSSSSRTSSQPFVFRWDGISAAGDMAWIEIEEKP